MRLDPFKLLTMACMALILGLAGVAQAQEQIAALIDIGVDDDLSQELDVRGYCVVGLDMPSGWDAADITWTCSSVSGGTFDAVTDGDGTALTVTAAASKYIDLTKTGEQLCGCAFAKLATSAAQTANRTIILQLAR